MHNTHASNITTINLVIYMNIVLLYGIYPRLNPRVQHPRTCIGSILTTLASPGAHMHSAPTHNNLTQVKALGFSSPIAETK